MASNVREPYIFHHSFIPGSAPPESLIGRTLTALLLVAVAALSIEVQAEACADPSKTSGSAAARFQSVGGSPQGCTARAAAQPGSCNDAQCDPTESACSCPADCGSPPSNETTCDDAIDEDCDGPIDCADFDCITDPACAGAPAPNRLMVTEVMSNSPASPDVEYIEILNLGPGTQDLTGWSVLDDDDAHRRCFLDGTLGANEYRVVAGFNDTFLQRFPEAAARLNATGFDSDMSGQGFSFGDGGDQVRLFRTGPGGNVFVDGYTFGPQAEEVPFGFLPRTADAPEYLADPTPGRDNGLTTTFSPVCINEFLTTSQLGGIDDWVELYNRGNASVDIGGWFLSDTVTDPTKYVFPPATILPPGGFLGVDEVELGFSFSSTGSEIVLLTHSDGTTGQDYFDYDTQFPDVSRGRFPDGAATWRFFASPTRDLANGCPVRNLGFSSRVVFGWDAYSANSLYDLIRGDLITLRSTGGDHSTAVTGCEADDLSATGWSAEPVAPGEGRFYLVRAVDAPCGSGTYDSGPAARDAAIASSTSACP